MKTALDWRALVADVLTMERLSRGTRWANTQQARDNIKKWIWICDDARNCINRIMDMVQSVLDVRIKCNNHMSESKHSEPNSQFVAQLYCIF